jgi:hypothetical protein
MPGTAMMAARRHMAVLILSFIITLSFSHQQLRSYQAGAVPMESHRTINQYH